MTRYESTTEKYQRNHLKRYRYLRLEPTALRTSQLHFLFMGFAIFAIGILIGFNFKDVMRTNCCLRESRSISQASHIESTREATPATVNAGHAVLVKKINENDPILHMDGGVQKKVFEKLPDKYLKNVTMPPPAKFFNLKPWKVMDAINNKNDTKNHLFLVLVKSAAIFAKRRFQIRLTWGSMTMIEGRRIGVMFVVGVARTRSQQRLVEEENTLFGDLVQGDVPDVYRQLPTKVLSGYQFVTEYLGNVSDFIVSTDDDCFLNVPEIYQYLSQVTNATRDAAHCGYVYSRTGVRVTKPRSKYAVSDEIYPYAAYPGFCHGGLTLLSFNMVKEIYHMSRITNYTGFHLEDVLTNGILREKLPSRDTNLIPVRIRDPRTKKRIGLVWHLGLRKDKDEVFLTLWRGLKTRFSKYVGPYIEEKGYRVEITPMNTFNGKSVKDTILHFCPDYVESTVKVGSAQIKLVSLPKAGNNTR